jgi:hypothetical protein
VIWLKYRDALSVGGRSSAPRPGRTLPRDFDSEGWPVIPGRHGRIEHPDEASLAVYSQPS